MNDYNSRSRVNKFEKRRKNTKAITLLVILGSVLLLVLFMIFTFGGKDKHEVQPNLNDNEIEENNGQVEDETDQPAENNTNENTGDHTDHETDNENDENVSDNHDEDETVILEPSNDDNVISAFSRNWDPIGTKQSEPHTIQYDKGTQDRNEMEEAVRLATGLDDMIVWWLGRGGDQKVIATVSSSDQTETYRVYLSWITEQGWQPTSVEVLQVNDKHRDYKDNQEEQE